MYNISGKGKDSSNENVSRRTNVPPLFGLETITDLRMDRNRTPNIPFNSQNRSNDDDIFSAPRFIYSPTPIDKVSNSYNSGQSPLSMSPGVFNTNRYNFSPSYNSSPSPLLITETPSQNQNQSQNTSQNQSQNQSQPLSMSSLINTTNNMEIPKSEPLFTQPSLLNSIPPPPPPPTSSSSSSSPPPLVSQSPPSLSSFLSSSPPLPSFSLPLPSPPSLLSSNPTTTTTNNNNNNTANTTTTTTIKLPSLSPTFLSRTPKFEDLPPLSGDIYSSSLFNNNNNNNNGNNSNSNINGLSGLLSKATLDDNNFNFNINNINNNNNNQQGVNNSNGDILLFRNDPSPIFDVNRFLSNSMSSNINHNHNRNSNNNNNNNRMLFSEMQLPRERTTTATNSLLSSASSVSSITSLISSKNNNNNNSNDSFIPSEMDIANYENLMKELVMCQMCAQRLQKVKCFSYNGGYLCCSCSGKIANRKTLGDWETEEQNGVLCKRLNHHKNRVSYMKKQANGSFKIETLCIFCRNMKSYEYYRKQENKTLKI